MNHLSEEFKFKEFVESFSFSTIGSENNYAYRDVVINGRPYSKYGTLQAVTFVANKYRVSDKYVLVVGIAKQHPCDTKITREEGVEAASEKLLNNPAVIMEVDKHFACSNFNEFCRMYLDQMKLQFVLTKEEVIAKYGCISSKWSR